MEEWLDSLKAEVTESVLREGLAYMQTQEYYDEQTERLADLLEDSPANPALEAPESPSAGHQENVVVGPSHWWEGRDEASDASYEVCDNYATLTSSDMYLSTLKRRIAKFLEPDDYYVTIGARGKKTYHIHPDMLGWVNRRLR